MESEGLPPDAAPLEHDPTVPTPETGLSLDTLATPSAHAGFRPARPLRRAERSRTALCVSVRLPHPDLHLSAVAV